MTLVFNRIIELIGWVVLGVSLMLLVVAHHIDDYQTPAADAKAQTVKTA
ncbi:division septum protein Blr [Pluralibacter gergoviae]|nr:division septum protein Blr [uncultured Pluralibacter sp.]